MIDVLDYSNIDALLKTAGKRMTSEEIRKMAKGADKIIKSLK